MQKHISKLSIDSRLTFGPWQDVSQVFKVRPTPFADGSKFRTETTHPRYPNRSVGRL